MDERERPALHPRRGFALLVVLWTMVAVTALAVTLQFAARETVRSVMRRAELARGFWLAEDCIARTRMLIDAALRAEVSYTTPSSAAWRTLGATVSSSPHLAECAPIIALVGAGSTLDVNAASGDELRRLLRHNPRLSETVDSIADAILDWRDGDDLPRAYGAERAWYEEHGRHPPRNAPLADGEELKRIRGTPSVAGLHELLGTEPGRVSLAVAPEGVLASLPGMTEPAIARILDLRERRMLPATLAELVELMEGWARDSLRAHFAELARTATIDPEAWILTVRARTDLAAAPVTIELRLVRSGPRAVVVRRREWP